ncbi:thioester-containing protein 1 allele S3-like [Musca autumnalis]|uniref:thioester-containing protein 1 allele S3-like n=1 Tax=Musca autumnalis TaxID=221902 RepID=UPI003CF855DF
MKFCLLLTCFIVLRLYSVFGDQSYYSIIAPGTIKSNRKYSVVVTLHDAVEPATIRFGIVGPSYNQTQSVSLQPYESQQVDFMPAKLKQGRYTFFAEGVNSLAFKNETVLLVEENAGPKIYVQTDKAVYKPLDLVQFRVVILDEHTRPINITEPIRVEIMDANKNRVKQFKDIELTHGVFTNKFNLSEHPALGLWRIVTTISGKYAYTQEGQFKVKKYILPKFYVTIENTANVTPDNPIIKMNFYGKYNFGRYVEGNATISVIDWIGNPVIQDQHVQVNGDVQTLDIFVKNFENYNYVNSITIKVKLTEKYTSRTASALAFAQVQQQEFNIIVDTADIEFENGKPSRIKVKVKQWNGTAVRDASEPVFMIHGDQTYKAQLNDAGVAVFNIQHDTGAKHIFKYRDSSTILPNIYITDEGSNNKTEHFCKLTILSGRLQLGKMLEIEVSSSNDIPYILYTLTGHGNIIRTELIKMPLNKKSYIIRLMPTIEMIPQSYIYVHYVHEENYRYVEMALHFPSEFENKITLSAPEEARPGQNVTINITAQPNSFVCLLAVDIGVYLLDRTFDLDRTKILRELSDDLTYSPVKSNYYPGIISGLLTFTNAHYPFSQTSVPRFPISWGSSGSKLRKKFPETWIFQNLKITKENTQLSFEIPDTITTWRITAFTTHKNTGFGIVDGSTNIVTIKPFFLDITLPYSVKRDEIVTLPITLFNYHNNSLDAEVFMYNDEQEEDFNFFPSPEDQKQTYSMERLTVPSNGVASASFQIIPQKIGAIKLNVSAKAANHFSDAVLKYLKVEPEGIENHENQAMILRTSTTDKEHYSTLSLKIPQNIVTNSEHITVSMVGDALGPTLENLNGLVMKPTGCGEQNMVNFAPNILVLQYLKIIGKYGQEKDLIKEAKSFVEIGYQQEVSFRHTNGGYSVFGERRDREGASTWLTAYVIRFFIKASPFVSIEEKIITSGLDFLSNNQRENGAFAYTGYLFYTAQENRFAFTAFVLLTFMESKVSVYLNV